MIGHLFFIKPRRVSENCSLRLKPGFHISQIIGDLLSVVNEEENDFINTKYFIHH